MKIFEPENAEEALKGWLIHSSRRRTIHELASRRLDHQRLVTGTTAAVLAAVAGSTAFAGWQSNSTNSVIAVLATVVGLAAAGLATGVTFLDFGRHAEAHRRAAASYKDILRTFELWSAEGKRNDDPGFNLKDLKGRLAEIDAAAPILPDGMARKAELTTLTRISPDLLTEAPHL